MTTTQASNNEMSDIAQSIDRADWCLITGASKRIGLAIATMLFKRGENIVLHAHNSVAEAGKLANLFNLQRANSCKIISADLSRQDAVKTLLKQLTEQHISITSLVNNASAFYPGAILNNNDYDLQWQHLMRLNWQNPIALIRALANSGSLKSVVNLVDIYASAGLENHTAYVCAKQGLLAQSRSLARQYAPRIRINCVSPGAIMWPEIEAKTKSPLSQPTKATTEKAQQDILQNSALKKMGSAEAIASAVCFLLQDASYVTGQNIKVDGGRRWYI